MPKINKLLIVNVLLGSSMLVGCGGAATNPITTPANQVQPSATTAPSPTPLPTQKPSTPTVLATLAQPPDAPVTPTATRAVATNTPRPTLAQTATKPVLTATAIPKSTYHGYVGGFAPVTELNCPPDAPIKGNANSMIYHRPGQQAYAKTKPEVCFARTEDAEASGFRAAKR